MNFFTRARHLFGRSLSCEAANDFIIEYLEDALPLTTRQAFDAHLDHCPLCRDYLDQYLLTIELARQDRPPEPPPELVKRTLAFLEENLRT